MSDIIQAAVTVLSLINPVICGALFVAAVGSDSANRFAAATKASAAIMIILLASALFGQQVLQAFGISLDAFQVAGGIVLAWMGFSMLKGSSAHTKAQQPQGGASNSLAPLILFAASPGTITGVMTIAISHSTGALPVSAIAGVIIAVSVTWVVMLIASRHGKSEGESLGRDITTRFMGLIVLAMGIQFALAGYRDFMGPA